MATTATTTKKIPESIKRKVEEWRIGDYTINKLLGEGGYSKVYQGIHDKTDHSVALKISKQQKFDKDLILEADILNKMHEGKKHPYIIGHYEDSALEEKYIEQGQESKKTLLVYNLCQNGTLFDFVCLSGSFSEKLSRTYFKQFVSALEHIHAQGYVHRDLKAENLLLDSKYSLQVSDFGLAGELDEKGFVKDKRVCGTTGYMAPEIFTGDYGIEIDVFSMGIILFCFLCGRPPFTKTEEDGGVCPWWKQVKEENYEKFWTWQNQGGDLNHLSDDWKKYIMKFLKVDPKKRITIEEMKADKWWKGETYDNDELFKEMEALEERSNIGELQPSGSPASAGEQTKSRSGLKALPNFNILVGKENVKKEYDQIDIYEETDEIETDSKDELLVYNSYVINRTKFLTKEAPHLITRGLEAICDKENIAYKRKSNYLLECIHEGLDDKFFGGEKKYKFLIQVYKSVEYEGCNWIVFNRRCDSLLQYMQLYAIFHSQLRNYIVTTATLKNQEKSTTATGTTSCITTTVECS